MFATDTIRDALASWVVDAGHRSRACVLDLPESQWTFEYSRLLTPFDWEFAHVTWFHERFVLREALGQLPRHSHIDGLYDSSVVPHADRYHLELLPFDDVLAWDDDVRQRELAALETADDRFMQLLALAIFHEDMHAEAFTWMRQSLAYPRPRPTPEFETDKKRARTRARAAASVDVDLDLDLDCDCDLAVDGAVVRVGSTVGFDNELEPHDVLLSSFRISRRCVDEIEFLAFVEDDGYERDEFWCPEGASWKRRADVHAPATWAKANGGWCVREFDRHRTLSASCPVIHVSWYEASAWCRWAGRRLPTEHEWEYTASLGDGRRFPWGDAAEPGRSRTGFSVPEGSSFLVAQEALRTGRSPGGVSQMIGNVWEWTSSVFLPYTGFRPGTYENYSAPFFGSRRVLRGGSWCTTLRMLSNSMRNFFEPERRDIFAGFRTCALDHDDS
ncbi:MAG: ergothioneine biosynthesis protein EgtB [Planctomycetes bacterium]|nr:ergothioneine biosynthesis protein EgtB [Planctomycetota bacterium]MCB9891121.1 ergothioneine biosynthesis protein EgtB [Planctomycetota bacterium]MCB9918889.1 ergothioneine biosynthesis protein EgtB [Planctomycetota bacterium]